MVVVGGTVEAKSGKFSSRPLNSLMERGIRGALRATPYQLVSSVIYSQFDQTLPRPPSRAIPSFLLHSFAVCWEGRLRLQTQPPPTRLLYVSAAGARGRERETTSLSITSRNCRCSLGLTLQRTQRASVRGLAFLPVTATAAVEVGLGVRACAYVSLCCYELVFSCNCNLFS